MRILNVYEAGLWSQKTNPENHLDLIDDKSGWEQGTK